MKTALVPKPYFFLCCFSDSISSLFLSTITNIKKVVILFSCHQDVADTAGIIMCFSETL